MEQCKEKVIRRGKEVECGKDAVWLLMGEPMCARCFKKMNDEFGIQWVEVF